MFAHFESLNNIDNKFSSNNESSDQMAEPGYRMSLIQSIRESDFEESFVITAAQLEQFEKLFNNTKETIEGKDFFNMAKALDLEDYNITQDELLNFLALADDEVNGNYISQAEYFNVIQRFADKLPKFNIQPKKMSKDSIYNSHLSVQSASDRNGQMRNIIEQIRTDMEEIQTEDNQAYDLQQLINDFRINERWKEIGDGDWGSFFEGLENNLQVINDKMEYNQEKLKQQERAEL